MKVSFTIASTENIAKILLMMEDFYEMYQYPFNKSRSEKNLHDFIKDPTLGRFWIISLISELIGYIALSFGFSFGYGGKDALLDELYIKPSFRNEGIGKIAMEFIENEVKGLGLSAIHLEVENKNEKGKRLYTNQGFKGSDCLFWSKRFLK